jgi:uncharacterized protein (DUF952 family)
LAARPERRADVAARPFEPFVRLTYHLTPQDWWEASDPTRPLTAPSLAVEGFIHCTDGASEIVTTANRHYRDDRRSFVVVSIDLDRAGSPWRVEDPGQIYPHVFGPIERPAVVAVVPAPRAPDGTFLPFES